MCAECLYIVEVSSQMILVDNVVGVWYSSTVRCAYHRRIHGVGNADIPTSHVQCPMWPHSFSKHVGHKPDAACEHGKTFKNMKYFSSNSARLPEPFQLWDEGGFAYVTKGSASAEGGYATGSNYRLAVTIPLPNFPASGSASACITSHAFLLLMTLITNMLILVFAFTQQLLKPLGFPDLHIKGTTMTKHPTC